jgi:non-ribosomal peptide synthetase component F
VCKVLAFGRYTGQDDIVVGSPTANRNKLETEDIVGYFINPVALRALLNGKLTVRYDWVRIVA